MPADVFAAARQYFDVPKKLPIEVADRYAVAAFYAGAAWGASVSKLSQAEIAAIVAAADADKKEG